MLIVIETPYRGDGRIETREYNAEFARNVCRYAIFEHLATPVASHLFFTQFLNEDNPKQRQLGINMGVELGKRAQEVWFCLRPNDIRSTFDSSLSAGMDYAYGIYSQLEARLKQPKVRFMVFEQDGTFVQEVQPPR